jgi:DNA polymerase epsilon subunit 1
MHSLVVDLQTMPDGSGIEKSGMDLYFIERGVDGKTGNNFKATVFFEPYLYLDVSDPRRLMEISNQLVKRFEGCKVSPVEREDLDLPNHLSGKKHPFLKLSFGTVTELNDAKFKLKYVVHYCCLLLVLFGGWCS